MGTEYTEYTPVTIGEAYSTTPEAHGVLMSGSIANLAAALSAAQGEFEAVDKTASNPFFKSSYAPLPDVVMAAAPILAKHGLSVWQSPTEGADGKDRLWTVLLHSSGEYLGAFMPLRPVKQDPQAQGSAITYGRRYAYMAALGLVADEDDDGNSASGKGGQQQRPAPKRTAAKPAPKTPSKPADKPQAAKPSDTSALVSEDTLKALRDAYKASGVSAGDLRKTMAESGAAVGAGPGDLTEDQATWVVIKLKQMKQTTQPKQPEQAA
jgi:hypothetical protein